MRDLKCVLAPVQTLSCTLSVGGITTTQYPFYHGEMQFTPLVGVDQVVDTDMKVVSGNMVVKQIPAHSVSNDAGGMTFSIGG